MRDNLPTLQIELPKQDDLAALCHRHRIRQLALFGSALHNDFGPESDVDILVEFEPGTRLGLLTFIGIQEELSGLFQRPVDLVTSEGLKPLIKEAVLNSIHVIYYE